MKKTMYSTLIFAIIVSCTKEKDEIEVKPIMTFSPKFMVELVPVDNSRSDSTNDRSINVIQGIAPFEGGWFTSQTSQDKYLIINYLSSNGDSMYDVKLDVNSHAQDLSIEIINERELYLYTSEGFFKNKNISRGSGIIRLHVNLPVKSNGIRDMSDIEIKADKVYKLNYINSTPTISEDKTLFAIRSNNTIHVHSKTNIDNYVFNKANYHFQLNKEQLVDNLGSTMWFQGIALKNGYVYCLTGNNKVFSVKKLFVYDEKGVVISKSTFMFDDFELYAKVKLEPESLAFVGDDLYMTMMTEKANGENGNAKFLFKLRRNVK